MYEKRSWFSSLMASDRIALTCPQYFKRLKTSLLIFSLLSVISIGLLISFSGLNFTTLGISMLYAFIAMFVIRYFSKNIQASLIKGGTLILTDLNKRSYVTSIRSIRDARSFHIGSMQLTRVKYELDGMLRKAIIVNTDRFIPFNTDKFLYKAKEIYKKQKANL